MLSITQLINYKAFALLCGPIIMTGPCGTPAAFRHRPMLLSSRTGTPITFTLFDSLNHLTVTHGDGPQNVLNVQPTTRKVSLILSKNLLLSALALVLVV